ncbi:MAG TPA: ATP-binding protein, partial [Steroidobacteraceae bacterium]
NPPVLEQLGLVPALEWLTEEMHKNYRMKVHINDDHVPKIMDGVSASIVYRAVRELLINVARHAQVDTVRVTARGLDGHLTVQIADNGVGFDPSEEQERGAAGLGLATLRERIGFIGGKLTLDSERGRGTVATIAVPLHK